MYIIGTMVVLTCCKGYCIKSMEYPIFCPSHLGNPLALTDSDSVISLVIANAVFHFTAFNCLVQFRFRFNGGEAQAIR